MTATYVGDGGTEGEVLGRSSGKVAFYGGTPATQGAALTAQLTTITPADAEGTPDYAIQAIHNTNAYGFVTAQEAIMVLYVIKNMQTRVAELEARLESVGLIASN